MIFLIALLVSGPLVKAVPLDELVDKLAQAHAIEGERIGYAGERSETFALAQRIIHLASPDQAQALLQHQSPVVRGYLARNVIEQLPGALPAVYPLLADSAEVRTRYGCLGGTETISGIVLDALSGQSDRPDVQALLLRAAYDPQLGELRGKALEAVAKQRPAAAAALAKSLLQDPDPALLGSAIRALGLAGSSEMAPILCGLASSGKPKIREAVAEGLGPLHDDCVEPALRKLAADFDPSIRMRAGASYARTPKRDLAVLRPLLRDREWRVNGNTALALADLAGPQDLELLKVYFAAPHDDYEGARIIEILAKGLNFPLTAFMRELLTGVLPPHSSARVSALDYLRDAADRQSLPIFLKAVRSGEINQQIAGAEGIGAVDGRSAIPALEKMLGDENPHGRLAAARALVALHAVESREALVRAAEAETTGWAKKDMKDLSEGLR